LLGIFPASPTNLPTESEKAADGNDSARDKNNERCAIPKRTGVRHSDVTRDLWKENKWRQHHCKQSRCRGEKRAPQYQGAYGRETEHCFSLRQR
jgi:hypothetical protein